MRKSITLLLLLAASGARADVAWQEAPAFRRLFAAAGPRGDAYSTFVSPLDLDAVLTELQRDPALLRPPGAWQAQALLPLDAFGQTGTYDRWAVLRLYGAQRARVARGPRTRDGRVVESWTLISPYPDATLQRLEPGTLLIVLRAP